MNSENIYPLIWIYHMNRKNIVLNMRARPECEGENSSHDV